MKTYNNFKNNIFEYIFIAPALAYLLGFLIIVITYLIKLSLTSYDYNFNTLFPCFDNWVFIFNNHEFKIALNNTFWFVIIGTPLELIVGLILAFLIYNNSRGNGIIRSVFTLPLAIPALVTAIILFIVVDYPGGHINNIITGKHWFFPAIAKAPINFRANSFFALGVSMAGKIWRDMPISMLIILTGLNNLDKTQLEAAKTMGAKTLQSFWYIILPQLIPSISSVLVLRSIEMWKEFIFPFVLSGKYPLLGTLIESFYHSWQKPEQASVVALILLLCVLISTVFIFITINIFRKRIVKIA